MYEMKPGYWDPSHDTSTRTSVVKPVGNPQQVYVQPTDSRAFYNQFRVDPRWGLDHVAPAVLRPDPMWSHRWPDIGPYRGMTPEPFAWEKKQDDGLGSLTQSQRDRYQALNERIASLWNAFRETRNAATSTQSVGRIALIEGQLESAQRIMLESAESDGQALDMAMDDVDFELDQVEERLMAAREQDNGSEGSQLARTIGGGAVLLIAAAGIGAFLLWR